MSVKTMKRFKYGCLWISLLFIISIPISLWRAFGPTTEIIKIKQNIGGVLVCSSNYSADLASWFYNIHYVYVDGDGDSTNIGSGEYFGQDWHKDEQIRKIDKWSILKTGGGYGADKLLIGKVKHSDWKEFIISPDRIEGDSLWKSQNIAVMQDWLPQESAIERIDKNKIIVEYKYRIGEEVEEQEVRVITYSFDTISGIPKMIDIKLKELNY